MQRSSFQHNNLTLSWLNAGGAGSLLIALHAHWMEAVTFRRLANDLAPGWRVVALDQRGHGHSSHAASYTRQDYPSDLEAFFAELQVMLQSFSLATRLAASMLCSSRRSIPISCEP